MGIYGSFRILPVSVRCLFPRAMSQADMLACPFGGAVCRWHTVSTDRNEVQTCCVSQKPRSELRGFWLVIREKRKGVRQI